jgi:hypothetical protein
MGEDPVVLERAMGAGTVVLCADGYALSNEALRKHRKSGWLAWLVGESDRVVFDERHLGVEEQTGVVTLARRYRLHGLGIGLMVLAGLWAWRSMMPLVPRSDPASADSGGAVVAGRDATIGLRNLLERHVPRAELLGVCLDAWRKSFPTDARRLIERGDQMTTVVVRERDRPAREQNLVGAYRELCELANPRQGRAKRSETESNYTDEHRHT